MILVASCLIPARRSVDSDASLGEKSTTRHKCGHERSWQLLGLACCVCLCSRCCCRIAFLPPSSFSVRVCVYRQFVLIKSFCFVCNSRCYCCCCCCSGETLTHSLSRLVSDTGATTRRVRGTAAVEAFLAIWRVEEGRGRKNKIIIVSLEILPFIRCALPSFLLLPWMLFFLSSCFLALTSADSYVPSVGSSLTYFFRVPFMDAFSLL